MAQPFAAETWVRRASIPNLPLNGVYSGLVQGPIHAVYDPRSRVVQSFSAQAHHFTGFASTAQISFDDGANWAASFDEGLNNKVVFTGWSMPHPSFPNASLHFQVRYNWTKAFLVADGSMAPGGIELWASAGGATFQKLQDLHTWPAINQIGGNGGAAGFDVLPSATSPILLEGSGPDGEDAYWFVSSYDIQAGGAGNRTHFKGTTLWRSIDGGITWEAARDMEPVTGNGLYAQFVRSTSGRLFLVQGSAGNIFYTDDADDLVNATWATSTFNGAAGVRGTLMEMYGGTFFTFSQGTLTGPGSGWISCDDGETFNGTDALIPQNRGGYGSKLGPTEVLVVAPGFSDPTTETCAYYSANGGEDFAASEPWIASTVGEQPVMLAIRGNGTPIVVTRTGGVFISGDKARGVAGTRTICPLANAGLAAARPLLICGHPLTHICEDH